jgi:hypothetical protein
MVRMGETRNAYIETSGYENLLENVHLKDPETDDRITLMWILGCIGTGDGRWIELCQGCVQYYLSVALRLSREVARNG